MARETTQQYIDRYWRKVFNKSTTKDRLIEMELKIDQHEFNLQRLNSRVNSMVTVLDDVGKLREEQMSLLNKAETHIDNAIKILQK
jgi:hypothetical protein